VDRHRGSGVIEREYKGRRVWREENGWNFGTSAYLKGRGTGRCNLSAS